MNGDQQRRILEDHLHNCHENLTWTVECVKEGGYLDLWLMLKDGIIEWKPFRKAPPIYVGPDSCHDPAQKGKSIMKGVGKRLRITSSKKTKQELLKFKDLNSVCYCVSSNI